MIKKQDVMTPYMENEARNNSQSMWVPGAQGMPVPSAQSTHRPGAQGRQVPSAQGRHPLGVPKIPVPSVQEGHRQSARVIEWRDLTLNQQRVLEWLTRYLITLRRDYPITCIYRRISADLKISPRAARVHMEALKKKRLISTEVAFRANSHQKIGLRVSISEDAPIRHLPHRVSKAEELEMRKKAEEFARKEAQTWDLLKKGFVLVPELNSYALPPKNFGGR